MFEHHEAVLTPLGGGTTDHSLVRPAHLAPCHDAFLSRLVRQIRENASGGMHVCERSVGRCLSIVELSRHHPVVGRSTIHRADLLTWPRATISVTLGVFLNHLIVLAARVVREKGPLTLASGAQIWATSWFL